MNRTLKPIIILVVIGCLFTAGNYIYGKYNAAGTNLQRETLTKESNKENEYSDSEEGKEVAEDTVYEAYDFTLNDLDGNEITLSDYKGKTVILNFWASWCSYCLIEMPEFNELYENEWKDSDEYVFFSVNMTDGKRETEEKARKVMDENAFTFPVLLDTEQDVAYAYGISSLPITIVIDKEGNIATGYIGMMDKETINAMLAEVKE